MKIFNKKCIVFFVSAVALFSCTKLDEEVGPRLELEKPASVVVDEMLSTYDVLKSYANTFILGANASSNDLSNFNMATLLSTNFEQVTPLTALNSNVILANDGAFDFTAINSYVNTALEKGLSVYGDAIISNLNQNDTFLETIAAPLTYSTPLYPNLVNLNSIEDGTFNGWEVNGDVSVEDYMGEPSVKIVNGASVTTTDATSLQSPVYTVDENARFELTFYLLSTQVGEGRVIFSGLDNNEPEMDWTGDDSSSATFTTRTGWNKIQVQIDDFDDSGEFSFKIELGYTPDVTYFMNVQGLSLINLNGLVENPDEIFLEAEDAQQIGQWMVSETGDETSISGGETLVGIINGDIEADDTGGGLPSDPNNEDLQFTYTFDVKTSGTYNLWLRQKAYAANGGGDSFFLSVDGATYFVPGWPGWGDKSNTTNWTWIQLYTGEGNTFYLEEGEHTVSFRIREGGHYFDRIYFTMTSNEPSGFGSPVISQSEVTLEVSDNVRITAVEKVLEDYVTHVLDSLGDNINAWTVVKDPFAEDGNVAVSGGEDVEGSYYWADYIGADYIAQAFSTAKANAPEGTKLFISETNLNTNPDKLDAITSTVTDNLDIDGVAVSLNLDLESGLVGLGDMFDALAETGKLIYITDLRVVVSEHTSQEYALQSEVYQEVVDLYQSKVPAAQQYGISLSAPVSDNAGLWNSNYNRKHPYAGFAIGLSTQD
ncbi:endo-1,4-beta-xylanase [Autumnicola musiva]|uniref:Endo-1,4-beta-xylanase n=1 Tax=Autumnicola musiva TaxID=3075589 RepID=A0ABU3D4S5_9FLAO|nr:endo-1,4-beta-xylanase [Zunongwangia sp. F117]MDT0676543.1 endo-1,4-beta-xylanase [Zunongwangia sp. F117]